MMRVPKGGGASTAIETLSGSAPTSMAVHGAHVYWTDMSGDAVRRVNKMGGAEEVVVSGQAKALQVRLDETSVYWTTEDDGAVWKLPK